MEYRLGSELGICDLVFVDVGKANADPLLLVRPNVKPRISLERRVLLKISLV